MCKYAVAQVGAGALLAILLTTPGCGPSGPPPFRMIPDAEKLLIHGDYESTAILSTADLDSFLERLYRGSGDQGRGFREGLKKANLDFSKEALVIFKHMEGSISTHVTFESPTLRSRILICQVSRKEEKGELPKVGYHFRIMAVDKSAVDAVELQIKGRKTLVLPISPGK